MFCIQPVCATVAHFLSPPYAARPFWSEKTCFPSQAAFSKLKARGDMWGTSQHLKFNMDFFVYSRFITQDRGRQSLVRSLRFDIFK